MATFCLLGLVGGSYAAPITTTVTTVLLTRGLGIALCANATASARSQELLESGLARAKRGDLSGALEFFWGSLGVELRTAHPADRVSWGLHDTKGKCAPEELTALPIAGSPSAAAAAGALHSIGNFHILQAQFEAAVDCHALAKSVDPTSTPPLARLCPPGLHNPCGAALADLFFSSSVVKQVLWQRQQDPEPQQESLNGTPMAQVHTDLATQLDASGLTAEAERHRLRAHDAQIATSGQAHVGLAVHGALAVPLLYDSTEHVARERQRLLQRIAQLHTRVKTDGLVLADGELNSFSMPGTFKIAYQVSEEPRFCFALYGPAHETRHLTLHATTLGVQRCLANEGYRAAVPPVAPKAGLHQPICCHPPPQRAAQTHRFPVSALARAFRLQAVMCCYPRTRPPGVRGRAALLFASPGCVDEPCAGRSLLPVWPRVLPALSSDR